MNDIAPSPTEHLTLNWFKSSYSGGEGNECVEVADCGLRVAVRDSKTPHESLTFSARTFAAFVDGIPRAQPGCTGLVPK
ncbi:MULTISPECIES: DUF397 domain-containing protein [unclassified Streptomyces]|uniref:DUF397 domain-containing protein n=1 Tax=unclassified Streptomyces TaxID=2593676 RepID=UPI0035D8853D